MLKKLLLLAVFTLLFAEPVLAVPGDWWGSVKINDRYMANGSTVTAYVNGNITPAASSIVGSLLSNYYLVHVEAMSGDSITFKVNNIPVEQSAQSWSEGDHELNLSIKVNSSFTSSVSINATKNAVIDAINETGTSLEITTNNDVSGTVSVIKYSENPLTENFGVVGLDTYIQIETSPEIADAFSWAIIKIYYTNEEVNKYGLEENSLRIYYYNLTDGTWIPYNPPNGGVNTADNYVWANTTHFSLFGVYGTALQTTTTSLGTVTGGGGSSGGGPAPTTNKTTCPKILCVYDPCPNRHLPDANGCINCASPCPTNATTTAPSGTVCGNGICESGENNSNCPADCLILPTTTTPMTSSPITGLAVFVSSQFGMSLLLSAMIVAALIIVFYKKWYVPRKIKKGQ